MGSCRLRHDDITGAPETVLVVMAALVVFGPIGLAEAARGVGAVLPSLTPTIRELADVSTDLKTTLDREIGLNEIRQDIRSAIDPVRTTTASTGPSTTVH